MTFKVIDLFAGPGGLGEGFASYNNGNTFKIIVSAEMEESAHKTLTLRSFFRHIKDNEQALQAYYAFCNDETAAHPRELFPDLWRVAADEAQKLTLGAPADNKTLDEILDRKLVKNERTVLIGGPPCQAYSLVGRARNLGNKEYVAENDHRQYLYKQYLRILAKIEPTIFVMENVKGILSAKVGGRRVFHDILTDLSDPTRAVGIGTGKHYVIHSLVAPIKFKFGDDPTMIDARNFVVQAEKYGVPQARHRVILLGIRSDVPYDGSHHLAIFPQVTVKDAIKELPRLRSRISKADTEEKWYQSVSSQGTALAREARKLGEKPIAAALEATANTLSARLPTGDLRYPKKVSSSTASRYIEWVRDDRLQVWLNHEARSHMSSDLGRYLYASVFTKLNGWSPKGHQEFMLKGLAPDHANWETGKFADRFRVQNYRAPSTTITSHIAKDGHYFIHPDPKQCRSLTVREAARLQSFPDNYFFLGNRTQQYHQVGNAVPPLLASQIAAIVARCLD